ncbi:hypothetical protein SHIRM173S_01719 [Streptomyces hirsutus]
MVPSVVATAAVGIGLAQGALAASFSVSGQQFKVTADHLHGEGFAQYGGIDTVYTSTKGDKKTQVPVAISSFDDATITRMCQSVKTEVPLVGTVYLRLEAGNDKKNPVVAKNLYIDVAQSTPTRSSRTSTSVSRSRTRRAAPRTRTGPPLCRAASPSRRSRPTSTGSSRRRGRPRPVRSSSAV